MNKIAISDEALKGRIDRNESRSNLSGWFVVLGVGFEVVFAAINPEPQRFFGRWGNALADGIVALAVAAEISFSKAAKLGSDEATRRVEIRLADAETRAAEANERAAKADLARVELELKLQPRMLNQEQWDMIQSLRGKFDRVNVAFETDAEPRLFAAAIALALRAAGIKADLYPRGSDVHSFGTFLYEPQGWVGAEPRTIRPLLDILDKSDIASSLAVVSTIPVDILLTANKVGSDSQMTAFQSPMIIIGGKLVVAPAHWPTKASIPKRE